MSTSQRPFNIYQLGLAIGLFLFVIVAEYGQTKSQPIDLSPGEVLLNVMVTDRSNHPVKNLLKENFAVTDDGTQQKFLFFSSQERAVSYAIVIDTSGSTRGFLPLLANVAKIIVNTNKQDDETALIPFKDSSNITIAQDWTNDKKALTKAADDLISSGGTSVFDAIYLASDHVSVRKSKDGKTPRHRGVIVITDGEDKDSFYDGKKLIQHLRDLDVRVFCIDVSLPPSKNRLTPAPSRKQVVPLNDIVKETGGIVYHAKQSDDLTEIASGITDLLRNQYVFGFSPTTRTRVGDYHKIQVTLSRSVQIAGEHTVVARPGYNMSENNWIHLVLQPILSSENLYPRPAIGNIVRLNSDARRR